MIYMYLYIELIVEFNKAIYNGTETSGVIVVILNLLGGTSSINFNVTLSTLPVTATGTNRIIDILYD